MTFEWLGQLKSIWTAWFFLVFVAIVAWTLWPARRQQLESLALIPLADQPATGSDTHD